MRSFTVGRLVGLLTREDTFLRHDVDFSLEAAVAMAETERNLNVSAAYYLMVDSPFYTAEQAFLATQVLLAMNHTVGWHVDPRNVTLDDFADSMVPIPVSFHCARETELWTRFPGIASAYDPIWEGKYYADSRGRFAYGDPEDHRLEPIQINLHPEWWFIPDWHRQVDDETYEGFFHEPKSKLAAAQP